MNDIQLIIGQLFLQPIAWVWLAAVFFALRRAFIQPVVSALVLVAVVLLLFQFLLSGVIAEQLIAQGFASGWSFADHARFVRRLGYATAAVEAVAHALLFTAALGWRRKPSDPQTPRA